MRMPFLGRRLASVYVMLGLAFAAGCSSDASGPTQDAPEDVGSARFGNPGPQINGIASLTVTIDSATLAPTHGAMARAVAKDNHGRVLTGLTTYWQTTDTSVAKITSTGYVTAIRGGSVLVRAWVSGLIGTASLSVVAPREEQSVATTAAVSVALDSASLTVPNSGQATATLRDSTGRVISGSVTWSSTNTAVASVSSTGTVTAVGAGTASIKATAANGANGSANVSVVAPVARVATVAVTLGSSGINVGATTQAIAKAYDSNGNLLTGRAVAWSSSNGSVVSVNSSGVVSGVGAGSANVIATVESVIGSAVETVTGTAAQLAITTQPVGAVSGANLTTQPVVQVRDAANTVMTASTTSVTATLNGAGATLSGTTTASAVNGVATFTNLKVSGSGSHTITFTTSGLTSATSSSFTVAQTAASLSVQTQPANSTSGASLTTQPVVRVLDNAGLVDASFNQSVAVSLTIVSGSGTLSGTTVVTAVAGVASFTNLAVTGAGTLTLKFQTEAPALQVSSNQFTVAAAPTTPTPTPTPTQLAITTQPSSSATSGTAFAQQPAVQLRDASNQAVSKSGVVVTAAIASGGGTLGGTLTATTNASGLATFTNLSVTGTSGTRTLAFSATGLTGATSTQLTVSAASTTSTPAQLSITTQPSSSATSGTAFAQQPAVQVRDASNLAVSTSGVVVTAAIASGGGTLGGTLTATTNNSGVATFTNLSITGTSGGRTLTFTAPGLTSATSTSINVTATVTGTGFATPNIFNNASFENNWSGFTDWTTAAPPNGSGLSLDNTLAYDGSWSIRRTWSPNPSGDVGSQLASNVGSTDRIWVRFYFRLTAPVTTIMKFARFYGVGWQNAKGGLFLQQATDIFSFGGDVENNGITASIGLTQAQVIDGNWHSLEFEYWRNGDPSGWPSAAFWFDGKPQYLPDGTYVQYSCYQPSPPSYCSRAYWQGGRLYAGMRADGAPLGMMEWIATLNQGNTTTGQINLDRIAISTVGRIGP